MDRSDGVSAGDGRRTGALPLVVQGFVGTTLISLLVTSIRPVWIVHLVLFPGLPSHRLFTYAWAIPSVAGWGWASLLIVLAARLMAPFSEKQHLALLGCGIVVGGVCYTVLGERAPFAGPGFVAWGYTGAAVGLGLMTWSRLSLAWKTYTALMLIGLANAILGSTPVEWSQSITAGALACVSIWWVVRGPSRPNGGEDPAEQAA